MAGAFLWLLVISIPVAGAVLYFSMAGRRLTLPPPAAETAASAPAIPVPATAPMSAAVPPAPAPAPTAPAEDVLLVGLSARRPCWVSANVDGQSVIERLLKAGEQRTLEVRRELVITTGDASALELTFDGAAARPLGKSGEVVTARFNLDNFKSYLQVR
jgi:hypothetical protein